MLAVFGYILMAIGLVALLAGVLGGAREVLQGPAGAPEAISPVKLIELFLEILKLGGWQALCGVGFVLVVLGAVLVGIEAFSSGAASSLAAFSWRL